MSEQPEEKQALDQGVDLGRRKLAKIGAAAPVIMTLASRPVFGAQCLSQMMSGNASHQEGSCSLGWSPGGWCNAGGEVNHVPTSQAWSDAGLTMGTKVCSSGNGQGNGPGNGQGSGLGDGSGNGNCTFDGGSPVTETPFSPPGGYPDDISILEVITDPAIDPELRHCLTAYLNACLSESTANFNYILTKAQVLDLCSGGTLPPPYTSLTVFLDATWS